MIAHADATVSWTVPTYITNTRHIVSAQVTTVANNGDVSIAQLKLSIVGTSGDVVLDDDDMRSSSNPVAEAPVWVAMDTLQYGHNQTVQFKLQIWMKQSSGGERQLDPIYREVTTWNHYLVASDPEVDQFNGHTNAEWGLGSMHYEGQYLRYDDWELDDFTTLLPNKTCVVLFAHGDVENGEGFQKPPGGDDNITANAVTSAIFPEQGGLPPLQFAFLVGCHAGSVNSYLTSWLCESVIVTNRAALGFKVAVDNDDAAEFI